MSEAYVVPRESGSDLPVSGVPDSAACVERGETGTTVARERIAEVDLRGVGGVSSVEGTSLTRGVEGGQGDFASRILRSGSGVRSRAADPGVAGVRFSNVAEDRFDVRRRHFRSGTRETLGEFGSGRLGADWTRSEMGSGIRYPCDDGNTFGLASGGVSSPSGTGATMFLCTSGI